MLLSGCGDVETCVPTEPSCQPQYTPTYDAVYANTLATSCALGGCHGGQSAAGGLALGSTADEAYAALVDDGYLLAGDASCSLLFHVLQDGSMPPGNPLDDAERCAVQQWIDRGGQP